MTEHEGQYLGRSHTDPSVHRWMDLPGQDDHHALTAPTGWDAGRLKPHLDSLKALHRSLMEGKLGQHLQGHLNNLKELSGALHRGELGTTFDAWKDAPGRFDFMHLGNLNSSPQAAKFREAAEKFSGWQDSLNTGSVHRDVVKKFQETTYRLAGPLEVHPVFGFFNEWIGPHFSIRKKQIVISHKDLDPSTPHGQMCDQTGHGDFSTVLMHEAAHAWDYSRGELDARSKGKPDSARGYSYWMATHHKQIERAMPQVPDWMRDPDGPMSRFAYAAMVPNELPAIMTELAHIDPARYHAACDGFKAQGVSLDRMMTEFYGKKITPPRPPDAEMQPYLDAIAAPLSKDKKRGLFGVPRLWGFGSHPSLFQSYADADGDAMTFPDHRISWIPLGRLLEMIEQSGAVKTHHQ